MTNKKYLLGMLAMVLVFGVAFLGCDNPTNGGNSGTGTGIFGTWDSNDGGLSSTLIFNSNGTFQIYSSVSGWNDGVWSASGGFLTVNSPGVMSGSHSHSISGNTLTIHWSGSYTRTYSRRI